MSYKHLNYFNAGQVTSNTGVVLGPIDIRQFNRFTLIYRNDSTATAFQNMEIQAAHGDATPASSASDTAHFWVNIGTGILQAPSALGAGSATTTSPFDNTYSWLRIVGSVSAGALSASEFNVLVGGITI